MQVYPQQIDHSLSSGLKGALASFRDERNFDPASYAEAKAALLNDYMLKHKLKACVVAVSGGIDSALVLALVKKASEQEGSPIQKIVPICLPVYTEGAASNQEGATLRGEEVARALGLKAVVIDLSGAHQAIKAAVDRSMNVAGSDWASGQLTANTRTPANYYVTSLLSDAGLPAILVGTTNRDEGAYFGYVGKASDATVDVQLISDLHKSEVYRTAAHLGIPASVLNIAPAGDMYDGRTDEQVYGASYDTAELYINMKCTTDEARGRIAERWSAADREQYGKLSANLDNLHRYNAHKYISEWPGVHLNILPTAVPGGWQYGPKEPAFAKVDGLDALSGMFALPSSLVANMQKNPPPAVKTENIPNVGQAIGHQFAASKIECLMRKDEAQALLNVLDQQKWFPVGTNGYEKDYTPGDPVGSWRLRTHDEALAGVLWRRLRAYMEPLLSIPDGSSQDAEGSLVWRAIGVSPLFRFIKYEPTGSLVAHYDAPFDYKNGCRTLKSLILYLTDSGQTNGGITRFVRDPQDQKPAGAREYARDWPRCANPEEVVATVIPAAGNALVFDHRILHDSSPLAQSASQRPKIIMRTDIIYQGIKTPCAG